MSKISVVVPVYNVQDYLERCFNSILQLSNKNVEVILVDDGSTDESGRICDYYANKYNWIVFHKKNGGLSDARNYGLERATGEYVWFIDSDDYISENFLEIFKGLNQYNPDILVMNYEMIKNDCSYHFGHRAIKEDYIYDGNEYLISVLQNKEYYVPVWTNIYSRRYLTDNKFRFKKGIYHEDEELVPYLFLNTKKIVYLNLTPYKYVIRSNSIAHGEKWEKNLTDLYSVFMKNAIYFKKNIENKELKKLLLCDMVEKLIFFICKHGIPNSLMKQYIDTEFLKKYSLTFKTKLRVYGFLYLRFAYNLLFKKNEGYKNGS